MKRFFEIADVDRDIYLHLDKNKVYVTSTVDDVYDKYLYFSMINGNNITFSFYNKRYELTDDNNVKVTSKDEQYRVKSRSITENNYNQKQMIINRQNLIKKEWSESGYQSFYNDLTFDLDRIYEKKALDSIDFLRDNLDNIEQIKNETEKAIYIMNILCTNIQHNGMMGLCKKRDSISLLNNAKKNNKCLNCRGLAIVLSEILNIFGIRARYIVCEPYEKKCCDNHVIVETYIKEENKWIMLDPSYNLFFRDNKGRLLSISEYKKYLAYKESEIIIGENANYKCEPLDIRKYENSMIKKLYRLNSLKVYSYGGDESYEHNKIILGDSNYG